VIVGVVRSGLVEAVHPVSVVAVDSTGAVLASLGDDLERPFFARSAIKPFQALASLRGGADVTGEALALAGASHGGQPVHIAHVRQMLSGVSLDESSLLCPPDLPMSASARKGREPKPVFHNCSGKHAAMLRACVASGWPLDYSEPGHPLQVSIRQIYAQASGVAPEPVGVDGCSIPTLPTHVLGLARAFARFGTDPEMAGIRAAYSRFAALTSDGERREAVLARWLPVVVKGGAMGCIGLAWLEGDVAVAAKSWTGASVAAGVAVVEILRRVGLLPRFVEEQLAAVARPAVYGGGRPVGRWEPVAV